MIDKRVLVALELVSNQLDQFGLLTLVAIWNLRATILAVSLSYFLEDLFK
jgi:hypothetical protein